MKNLRPGVFVFLLAFCTLHAWTQTLPVGMPVFEDTWRRDQLKGKRDFHTSFAIRPLFGKPETNYDSLFYLSNYSWQGRQSYSFFTGKGTARLLPFVISQQYNSHHPYGWNDGAMIQAKGYQTLVSGGAYAKLGFISLQLRPEFVYAQNRNFSTFPPRYSDSIWNTYYYTLNRIDNPEKFGSGAYVKLLPGQSSLRFHYKKLSLGISTENLWWGPGVRNSLLMSNTAPGFEHISFNTTSPIITKIGSFEGQVIAGLLKNSGILPPDTARTVNGQRLYLAKPSGNRYINGMIVTWQPKWTKGLHLGISRAFYQYKSNLSSSFNGYFPVLGSFFKKDARDENSFGRDQLFSLFFRLVMPESKAEVYAEYGRNDHSQNLRDLLLEPEHARAYILGLKKLFDRPRGKDLELMMELTHLQIPSTNLVREQEGWYTHYQVRHGYTNRGQVLGAGIGPGGSSQTLGLNWINGIDKLGASFERWVHNNDFYYNAFAPSRNFMRHWVDLSLNFNKSWLRKRMLYDAQLSLIRTLNYQWDRGQVNHISARFAAALLF